MFGRLSLYILTFAICATIVNGQSLSLAESRPIRWSRSAQYARIAAEILRGMNQSVDPCDNFYEYMCGNWATKNPIPVEYNVWSKRFKFAQEAFEQIKEILEEPDKEDDFESIKLSKAYYRSCMNQAAIEARGIQPILDIINANGGWPIVNDSWSPSTKYTWQNIHPIYNRLYNTETFFRIGLQPDYKTSTRVEILVSPNFNYPYLGGARNESEDASGMNMIVKDYIRAMVVILSEFSKQSGVNLREKIYELAELFMFQYKLSTELFGAEDYSTYDRMTIKELQEYYDNGSPVKASSHINWLSSIRKAMAGISKKITKNTVIEVSMKNSFLKLKDILDNTPPKLSLNYVHWNLVTNLIPYVNKKMRDQLPKLNNMFNPEASNLPRWKVCITDMRLKEAISYAYVKKHSSETAIRQVETILFETKEQMKNLVTRSRYLRDIGKQFIRKKLEHLTGIIGYPYWYKIDTVVQHMYDGFSVTPNYFENVVNYLLFEIMEAERTYGQYFDKYQFFEGATTVNAFYYPQSNSIVIPLVYFYDGLDGVPLPRLVNYAHMGFTLGHEMSHVFYGDGLGHDEDGNVVSEPVDIITEDGLEDLMCLQTKFYKYIMHLANNETVHINGDVTLEENIADTIGLKIAYNLYSSSKKAVRRENRKLPGLQRFTDDQLFFMAIASESCEFIRPEMEKDALQSDVHTPTKFRIIGTFSNSNEFAKAFNCPVGSRMNPEKKCEII